MVLHKLLTLGVSLLLAGCVLQSETPNFEEAQGGSLPEKLGTHFVTENYTDGAWKTEEGNISFTAFGKHYVARNEKNDEIEVLFVALGKTSWVMQAAEKNKPSAYVLAEAKDDTLLLRPLMCDDLKKRTDVKKLVQFDRSDCFLKSKADLDVFKILSTKAAPAKMRLRAVI